MSVRKEFKWQNTALPGTPSRLAGWDGSGNPIEFDIETWWDGIEATIGNQFYTEYFVGDGSNVNFAVPGSGTIKIVAVFVGGQRMKEGTDYSKNDATRTVVLTDAPATGIEVDVEFFSATVIAGSITNWDESTWGLARIATNAEVTTGSDNTKGITPSKLTFWKTLAHTWAIGPIITDATASVMAGFNASKKLIAIAYATAADIITGTDNVKPLTAKSLIDYSELARTSVSVSAGTMTLDLLSKRERRFEDTTTQSGNFTVAFSNTTNAEVFELNIYVTGTIAITLPSSVVMQTSDARWNNSTKVLTIVGVTASPFCLIFSRIASSKFELVSSYAYNV